jgi:hypothetical protein
MKKFFKLIFLFLLVLSVSNVNALTSNIKIDKETFKVIFFVKEEKK